MKVLICVDYSAYTKKVLETAQAILGTRVPQPEITVLHVIDASVLAAGTGAETTMFEGLQDNSYKINEMAKVCFGDKVTYLEEYGVPQIKIDEVLNGNKFDLLVLGTRGRSAITKVFLGSETEHLLHSTKLPLLIIP
jgi:nucleotide-binding universal stress UspA family protein